MAIRLRIMHQLLLFKNLTHQKFQRSIRRLVTESQPDPTSLPPKKKQKTATEKGGEAAGGGGGGKTPGKGKETGTKKRSILPSSKKKSSAASKKKVSFVSRTRIAIAFKGVL